ncbi:MAG: DUF2937 family protein [Alphaproteobacteria bacterium]|nr:DUF2937 family protein [Alphaproteobacteria bacterium]
MGFVGRWLSEAISLGLSLGFAFAAMQVPALTHDYTTALRQVTEEVRHDVDQREASARHFYNLSATTDDDVIQALRPFEPSNAEGLVASLGRARNLRAAYDRIEAAAPILQPVIAAIDFIEDTKGYKPSVLATTFATFEPQIVISTAAAVYGMLGLLIGSLVAQLVISLTLRLFRGRRARVTVQT